jgi:hypothetical protein
MAVELVSDRSNVVQFPAVRRELPSIELVARLAPPRSLVDTLIAERGGAPHDAHAGLAREFAYQVRALEAGLGRDQATVRLRGLVDAHVAHAAEICRAYQEAADRLVHKEVDAAQAIRVSPQARTALEAARAELRGRAIAARVAADGALGAAAALAVYVREGLGGLPMSEADPRQLLLFTAAAG